ncbi:ribonuclease PH [Bacillota bacterium Meth-B3]|nr:ribonuclease PH [Christensenellaceae bacterium]MEA5066346.1 ribonuclease PH [Eubacteriales bacterium]
MRSEERRDDQLRRVQIIPHYTEMAAGSALIVCGRTRVLCTASFEPGVPPFLKGRGKGWVTAEYAMLPGATSTRKPRDGIKRDGRSVEIARLIGRAVRACCDLTRMGEHTVTLDCDVLQADGGTRTAAITGAFVALCLAVDKLLSEGRIQDSPVVRRLAAVSVGLVADLALLDLDYFEDKDAQADMNVVMTRDARGRMDFVEVQGTGEGRAFSRPELVQLLDLAERGIGQLMRAQDEALGEAARVIGKKPRLVMASANFGKLKELRQLLGHRFDVVSMKEMGAEIDVEECGATFEANALIKAEALCRLTGCLSVADDSGLEVDALNLRPGVYSARYAGVHGDDEANNRLLLKELSGRTDRSGRFVCAMALARPGRPPLIARGVCEGEILTEYRGEGGFGYDPLFYSTDLHKTFAEASAEEKNAVSHRARAALALLRQLEAQGDD